MDNVPLSHPATQSLLALITGGGFVGWYREHRRAKKDTYTFAMEMINTLSLRVDALVAEVAQLKAENHIASEAVSILKEENSELKHENARLKTALGEHGRAA